MNKKQEEIINLLLNQISADYRTLFWELASYAVSLNFTPVRNKTSDLTIDFKNNRINKTIMKMELYEQKHDGFQFKERDVPGLRLKFFATHDYSLIFQNSLKRVIENFGGKYTGCYGCGRCKGKPQGYVYEYPDGKRVFRCGSEQIPIFDFGLNDLTELKMLIKNQVEYWNTTV